MTDDVVLLYLTEGTLATAGIFTEKYITQQKSVLLLCFQIYNVTPFLPWETDPKHLRKILKDKIA